MDEDSDNINSSDLYKFQIANVTMIACKINLIIFRFRTCSREIKQERRLNN